jgi:Skp family chaperone for outer membrane proteins
MTEQVQAIVNIQFTPAGAELAIAALRKLPHEQVHELVKQFFDQYQAEINRLQADAEAAQRQLDAEVSDVEPKAE